MRDSAWAQKLEWWAVWPRKKSDMFSCLDIHHAVHVYDGHTDTGRRYTALASRGNK